MSEPWCYPVGKSECCGANIYENGICTKCGEHSDVESDDEDELNNKLSN
jgi:hypothetical protein